MISLSSLSILKVNGYRIGLSLYLGIGFSISVYNYWLVDLIPLTHTQIILYLALATFGSSVGYYLLLELWIVPRLREMTRLMQWKLIGISIFVGIFLMFAGTSSWNLSSRYIAFFLPPETLSISVPAQQNDVNPQIVILRISTSVGDVSYNTINYNGWTRSGYQLILKDLLNNQLKWTGRTGEQAKIVFLRSSKGGTITVSWNGQSQMIEIPSSAGNTYTYTSDFTIPFYASNTMLLLLVVQSFIILCYALNLLIWGKRILIIKEIKQSILTLSNQRNSQTIGLRTEIADRKNIILDWLVVFFIIIVATTLRVVDLENLFPYIDEYNHLIAAKQILFGSPISTVYQRGLFIVTLPAVFFFRLFGIKLWSARLPGVLFNSFAVIPLYLISKKINRRIALLACILYSVDPWIISIARTVREYAYYPFYFYWIIYGMIVFIEQFPNRFVVIKDWRKIVTPQLGLLSLILALPPVYAIRIDPSSTFKIILIAYIVFTLFVLGKFDLGNKVNISFLAIVSVGIVFIGYYYASKQNDLSIFPRFYAGSLLYFFPNPIQQLYFNRTAILYTFAVISAISVSLLARRQNFVPIFILTVCFLSMLFFTFFFIRSTRPRYLVNVQLWYIILIAIGLCGIWAFLESSFSWKRIIKLLSALTLLALTLNFSQILLPLFYNEQIYVPITEEYHDNVTPAYMFLLDKINVDDVLISRAFQSYVVWKGVPVFKQMYFYNSLPGMPRDKILSIVKKNKSGWIVLDVEITRPSDFLPHTTIEINNKNIEYIGIFGNQEIWHWSVANVSN